MTSDLDPANPFAQPSGLPFGLPDYTAIREEHYAPALVAGMAEQRAEVERIATDPAPATVENTLVALERSGRLLARAAAAFFNQVGSDSTPGLEAIEAEIAPQLAAHHDAVYLDARLHARLEALAADVDAGRLDARARHRVAAAHLPDRLHGGPGIALPEADQDRLRGAQRRDHVPRDRRSAARCWPRRTRPPCWSRTGPTSPAWRPTPSRRPGRPRPGAGTRRGYLVELILPTQQPVLASLTDRAVRERVHRASVTRGLRPASTTPARRSCAWPGCAPSGHACSATPTTPRTWPTTPAPGPPTRSTPCSAGSRRRPSRTPAPRRPTCRPPSRRTSRARQLEAVGLGLLRGAGPQGAVLARRRPAAPVPRARPRPARRRVPRGRAASTG